MTFTQAIDALQQVGYYLVNRYHTNGIGYTNEFDYKGQVRTLSNESVMSFAFALTK